MQSFCIFWGVGFDEAPSLASTRSPDPPICPQVCPLLVALLPMVFISKCPFSWVTKPSPSPTSLSFEDQVCSEHKILSLLSRTTDRQGLEVNYVQIDDKEDIFQSFCAYHVLPRYPPFLMDCCCFPRRHFHRSEAASQRPRNGKDACSSRKRYHVLTWIPLFSILTK